MDEVMKLANFTNPGDKDQSAKELPTILKSMKNNEKFKKLKKKIGEMTNDLNLNSTGLSESIEQIKEATPEKIVLSELRNEDKMFDCLREEKKTFEQIFPAAEVVQKLRKVDDSKVKNMENVISKGSTAFKHLKETGSTILNKMKEKETKEVKDLNEMRNSTEDSFSIGTSVNLLKSASYLKSIDLLKLESIDSEVKKAIETVKDKGIQKNILQEWGDIPKFVSHLKPSIQKIEDYSGNLTISDSSQLSEYGSSLEDLESIGDINVMDSKKKLNALDTLIASVSDPNSLESRLEETKRTLGHLNSLDLRFSYHSQVLQKTSKAIDDLFAFLLEVFSASPPPSPSSSSNGFSKSQKEENKPPLATLYLVIIIVVGVILLGALCYVAYRLIKWWRWYRWLIKQLRKFIMAQMFGKNCFADAYLYHEAEMRAMIIYAKKPDVEAALKYLPASKQPNAAERLCNPETALHHIMKDGVKMPIHANKVVCPRSGKIFYPTQAPIDSSRGKDDTREDFWHMCVFDGVEYIVMLLPPAELPALYFPLEKDEKMTCGRYELLTMMVQNWLGAHEDVVVRTIMITDTKGEFRKRIIIHISYISWPDMKTPLKLAWEPVYEMLKEVRKSKKPVVVHCISGIGRTMSFIGVEYFSEMVINDPKTKIGTTLSHLRDVRYDAVQTVRQCYWIQLTTCQKLNRDYKLKMEDELFEMRELAVQVCYNSKGPVEMMNRRKAQKERAEEAKRKKIKLPPLREETENLGEVVPY
uniref:Tyrosine-protein phosphatase domain-containing protein n=1 Tax=Caenorhabditis tropicalis TaxID=1561998 RepID=A0A1I7TQF0_9PELO